MKTTKFFLMAALALTFAACSNDDYDAAQPAKGEGIPFTATISIGDGATTRALSESGTKLVASWAENEKVALIHNGVTDEMTVSAVNDGKATITGTITGSPSNGDAVTVIYPSTAVDGTTGDVKADLLYAQEGGTLADVASKYDVRRGTGTLKVSGTASLNGNVSLANQFAIFKFTTNNENGSATMDVTPLTITIGGQEYVITPASATSTFYAALPDVSEQTVSFGAIGNDNKLYTADYDNISFAAGKFYKSSLKLKKYILDLSTVTAARTVPNGSTLTGTLANNVRISIADGATVTLQDIGINGSGTGTGTFAGITCEGDATIILEGTNTVKGFSQYGSGHPGIFVPSGKTLTVKGTGALNASSSDYCAGIGGGNGVSCGNIVIEGGTITATGGPHYGAGIGSGDNSACGNIEIKGGTVTANGGSQAAGIGAGHQGYYSAITISGGTVTATGNGGAGIGSGVYGSSCGNIEISGGTVTATGNGGAGIGSGYYSSCGTITITSGVTSVTAAGSPNSFGKGEGGTCGTVTIGGITVVGVKVSPYTYPSTPATSYTLAESTVGMVVCTDGKAYAVADKDNVPLGVEVVGIVACKNGSGGLVIALDDEMDGYNSKSLDWYTANGANGAAAHTPTVTGRLWKLPSMDEWKQMFTANGGSDTNNIGLNMKLTAAGGSALQGYYWTSTDFEEEYYDDEDCAWEVLTTRAEGDGWFDETEKSDSEYVRAIFSF